MNNLASSSLKVAVKAAVKTAVFVPLHSIGAILISLWVLESRAIAEPNQTALPSIKTFEMFRNKKVTPYFNEALTEILTNPIPRDYILKFSNHSFKTGSGLLLGTGGRNLIFDAIHQETGRRVALRVQSRIPLVGPFHKDVIVFLAACANPFSFDRINITDSIGEWFRGYERLTAKGAKVVPLHKDISDPPEFLAIEHRNIKMPYWLYKATTQADLDNYSELGEMFKSRLKMLNMTLEELDQNFCQFAASLAGFSMIGDFRGDQMAASVEAGWEIFDMSDEYRDSVPNPYDNPFETGLVDNFSNMDRGPMQKLIVKPGFPPRVADRARKCFAESLKTRFQSQKP